MPSSIVGWGVIVGTRVNPIVNSVRGLRPACGHGSSAAGHSSGANKPLEVNCGSATITHRAVHVGSGFILAVTIAIAVTVHTTPFVISFYGLPF